MRAMRPDIAELATLSEGCFYKNHKDLQKCGNTKPVGAKEGVLGRITN